MKFEVLSRKQKKEIEKELEKIYGLKLEFPYTLLKTGKNKIRIFTGEITKKELNFLASLLRIESVGLPFLNLEKGYRIAFDAATIFGKKAKSFVSLNRSQAKEWIEGKTIKVEWAKEEKFVFVKYEEDILGIGKLSKGQLLNFVPKERRASFL